MGDSGKIEPGDADATRGRTYDPNDLSVWPVYPPGTRPPMAKWSPGKNALILVFLLVVMAGAGALVWWVISPVASRRTARSCGAAALPALPRNGSLSACSKAVE